MAEIERKLTLDFADQLQEAQIAIEIAEAKHDDWKAKVKEAIKAGKTAPQPPPPIPEEPIMPRLVPSDVTIERLAVLLARAAPKGVMMTRDELAGWLLGMTAYNDCARAFWIEAYGARPYRVDRVKHPEPIIIPRPAVSWHGGIQPERLAEVMQEADDDLLARFIWFWPEPVPFYIADAPPEIDWAVTCFDRLRMLDLVAGANGHQSLMVPLTADAVRRLEQSDWVALFRSLTVDTLDSVDTVSTAHADAGSLTADTFDSVDTVDEAPPSGKQSVNSVQSVNVSEEEGRQATALPSADSVNSVQSVNVSEENEGEAATSPLAAALAALERRCPDHIEASDWQYAVEDGRRFLIKWGEQATALGWAEADIFGLPPSPSNPHPSWQRLARVDQFGLVWLTHGRPVTAITAESATIATPSGGSLAFYRPQARQEAQQTIEQAAGDTGDTGDPVVGSPAHAGSAAKPSYEVIGGAKIGRRCAHCDSSIGARLRIK